LFGEVKLSFSELAFNLLVLCDLASL